MAGRRLQGFATHSAKKAAFPMPEKWRCHFDG
jgi:hypothetical protein